MTYQEFRPLFDQLSFKAMKKPSEGVSYAYFDKLKHLETGHLQMAIDHFTADGEHFPTAQNILEWMHRNVVTNSKRETWSFYCKRCEYTFCAHVDNLTPDKTFGCSSCDMYSGVKTTWNGEYLRKQMEQSKSLKQTYALNRSEV
jgi:hypothetical protein